MGIPDYIPGQQIADGLLSSEASDGVTGNQSSDGGAVNSCTDGTTQGVSGIAGAGDWTPGSDDEG